jgi:hypothetical protein
VLAATLSLEADFRSRASSILSENEGPAAGAVCAGDGMVSGVSSRSSTPSSTARLTASSNPSAQSQRGVRGDSSLEGTFEKSEGPCCCRSVSDFFSASRINDMC